MWFRGVAQSVKHLHGADVWSDLGLASRACCKPISGVAKRGAASGLPYSIKRIDRNRDRALE